MTTGTAGRPRRQRNRRGQGYKLREEILAAAAGILETTGNEADVTLREIARQIGIAPPSIAAHFTDPTEIIDTVVALEVHLLAAALHTALEQATDPAAALHAATRAYLAFGQSRPGRYRVLFERRFLPHWADHERPMTQTGPVMTEIITTLVGTLQAAVDAGQSDSTDPYADLLALWCALHGLVALPAAITSVPWPDHTTQLQTITTRLARLHHTPPPAHGTNATPDSQTTP